MNRIGWAAILAAAYLAVIVTYAWAAEMAVWILTAK